MKVNLCSIIIIFRLAVVAMAGLASEGLKYDKVVGQSADLFTLQVLDCYFFFMKTDTLPLFRQHSNIYIHVVLSEVYQ